MTGNENANPPVPDPTKNVLDLVAAGMQRQDDLRELNARWTEKLAEERQVAARRETELRHKYEAELRVSETARIDSIRQVDQAQVQRTADVQAAAATALASQVVAMAEAVRTTSKADLEPIQKAIDDLRKAQYEQAGGKAQVSETREVRGESRLNIGAVLGGVSIVLVLIFGVLGLVLAR